MGWILYLGLITFAVISTVKKVKNEGKKAAEQARRRAEAAAERNSEPERAGFDGIFPDVAMPKEGECAPAHMHSAQTQERHVLEPSYVTGHAHTESSMAGISEEDELCPAKDGKGAVLQGENSALDSRRAALLAALKTGTSKPGTPKAAPEAVPAATPVSGSAPAVDLSCGKLREAVILSEIIGKPKALRR